MNLEEISVIMPYITALAAVVCPAVSTIITARSNERIRRSEQYTPQKHAAVKRFTEAYSSLNRSADYSGTDSMRKTFLDGEAKRKYKEFCAAAYEVISFIPSPEIQDLITKFMTDLEGIKKVSPEEDKQFQEIAIAISKELSLEMSTKKQKRKGPKAKSNKSK